MLETISHLPNRFNMFTDKNFAIYVLDDYSVHVTDKVGKALLARGYILVVIGGGITGDVQINDTHVHHQLKSLYRHKESALMLRQLRENPSKIPQPSRDEMLEMLHTSWKELTVDPVHAMKVNFLNNAFDGSDDYIVSDKLFSIVREEMLKFRKDLLTSTPPSDIKDLTSTITPPKGVTRKRKGESEVPRDEGVELMDCEGEELAQEELMQEVESPDSDENESQTDIVSIQEDLPSTSTLSHEATDDETKADCAFLDDIQAVIDKHSSSTSELFTPQFSRFKAINANAQRSVKKRIQIAKEKA